MPIIIKKGAAQGRAEPAPVVEGALTARAPASTPPVKTGDQVLEWWKAYGLPPNPPLKICAFCKQTYYIPCTEERHGACANFIAQQQSVNLG